jgi:hypothetical protein
MGRFAAFVVLFVALIYASIAIAGQDSPGAVDRKQLREILTQLGHETKVLGEEGSESFEFKVSRDGLDIYLDAQISTSRSYLWLTANLGSAPTDADSLRALLRANNDIQPSHFYITKDGQLMAAIPVENRQISNPVLRSRIDKILSDIVATEEIRGK